jgi:asparagine synthase (glutamine-hydrolysing)
MCGIAGIVGSMDSAQARAAVTSMVHKLVRRGPDGEGIQSWPDAVLGHRRLSIYDLSPAGHQPMTLSDGSVSVVFNGAIYNFPHLRKELESAGCVFRSRTDTEVLLHGYRVWGIDGLLRRIRGMWAFALWDVRQRKLFLVRDRLGVKPLIFSQTNSTLAFASTVPALRAAGFGGEVDPIAVAEYLEFGYVTDQRVIYAGLEKLAAGEALEFYPGKGIARRWQYWELPSAEIGAEKRVGPTRDFDEALDAVELMFLDAVKLRLEADVPVGALLSGGIDSALVCWAIRRLGGNVRAFTVSTPEHAGDETEDARLSAQEIGIEHQIIQMDGADEPRVADLVAAYGEPFACSSALGMIQVSRAVRLQATVLLTGDGGDDLFLGYPEHRHLHWAQRLGRAMPTPLANGWLASRGVLSRIPGLRRPAHFLDYACGGLGAVTTAHDGLQNYGEVLGPRLLQIQLAQRQIPWSSAAGRRVLSDFLAYDFKTRFVGEYLTKVDGGAMYHALEARSPFLDSALWNYVSRLPASLRLRGDVLKALLRKLAARRISERVASGRKRGFNVPAREWMTTRWRDEVADAFANSRLAADGWLSGGGLARYRNQLLTQNQGTVQQWYAYVLEHWYREQLPTRTACNAKGDGTKPLCSTMSSPDVPSGRVSTSVR